MKTDFTINELRHAIWVCANGGVAVGGYPIQWYRDKLMKLTGCDKGYHNS